MHPTSSIEKFPFVLLYFESSQSLIHYLQALCPHSNLMKLFFSISFSQIQHVYLLGLK